MQGYFNILILLGILIIPVSNASAQRVPVAKNIDISIVQNKAIVKFDLESRNMGSTHLVDLKFLDANYKLISPDLLSGDIGSSVASGKERSIEWDITNDFQMLGSQITPVILVDGKSKQFNNTGGPKYAWLSVLMPGLGDYFVADHRMMTIKPYIRTAASFGLIGFGFWLGEQRYLGEGEWKTYSMLTRTGYPYYTFERTYYEEWVDGDTQYFLFNGDKEVFIALGAAIWAADVLWVLAKGTNNLKFLNSLNSNWDFQLGYQPGGASLSFSHTF